ncbi:hypothetical protein [[Mycobacterium] nativiensis]|uniref:Uncharacterized protein n=1 Tax=[Mycobacterium] nativiensis TaxID=2855503 RepID=A0ABU5Y4K5_9MYCO|nr:hypothetical protein [Mycolicibacter sp. MYC340]MEB3035103.1 hypothetical protein [Mycolicibacter sp. MYC340]
MDFTSSVDHCLRVAGDLPLPSSVLALIATESAGWEADKAAAGVQGSDGVEARASLLAGGQARVAAVEAAIRAG